MAKSNKNSSKWKILAVVLAALALAALGTWFFLHQQQVQRDKEARLAKAALFEKKQECAKLTSGIKKQIEEDNETSISGGFGNISGNSDDFEIIFYSPKENGCLYVVHSLIIEGGKGRREFFVYNALTDSRITSFRFPEQFDDYKKFVLDYSGGEVRP
jgi:hypothetical protein